MDPNGPHHQQGSSVGAIVAGSVAGVVVVAGAVTALIILTVFVIRKNNRRNVTGENIPLVSGE